MDAAVENAVPITVKRAFSEQYPSRKTSMYTQTHLLDVNQPSLPLVRQLRSLCSVAAAGPNHKVNYVLFE